MKTLIIAATPIIFIIWIVLGFNCGFVSSAILIAHAIVAIILIYAWVYFVVNHFNDD